MGGTAAALPLPHSCVDCGSEPMNEIRVNHRAQGDGKRVRRFPCLIYIHSCVSQRTGRNLKRAVETTAGSRGGRDTPFIHALNQINSLCNSGSHSVDATYSSEKRELPLCMHVDRLYSYTRDRVQFRFPKRKADSAVFRTLR